MSLEKAKKYLEGKGCLDHVIEPEIAAGNDHSAVKLTLPELVGADACIDPYSVTGMNH